MSNLNTWPCFSQAEVDAVSKVLLSNKVNYWTGEEGKKFETEFASWCDAKYSVALSNGTIALEIALKALDIGPGDEVIVTPRSFIASVSCVISVGARPVFADVDLNSGNINADSIKGLITQKTKAIICVHLAGFPCEMDEIMSLSIKNNIYVIEDCAQSHGAKYKGKPVGSIGHIGCWSFCQDKIMTTGGEGGMIATNNESLWRKIWSMKDHGKTIQSVYEKKHPPGYRWLHDSFGSNFRMTEMQATIGRIQLKRIAGWTNKRSQNANTILDILKKHDSLIRIPKVKNIFEHAWYKLNVYVKVDGLAINWNRDRISEEINKMGIPCYSGSCSEIYLEKAFDDCFRPNKRLKNAKELGSTTLMFLVHPNLSKIDVKNICSSIDLVLKKATKLK
ncbi:DegT/DnrJ/EryC1/StrS aminotransferase family protein [Candidatus Thioglobus sp.]|jgi:dTDP-4-amino-4,6-dideoxygalactose transaminase|nr:DegT/DnrJ/EryC1/StrS aminotransferase family protein [Candidatus Thioglobus sp.]